MSTQTPPSATAVSAAAAASDNGTPPAALIPELVAEVYEQAPASERAHMLEQLLRPLGVLSLFGIAGGVFANIRFRSGWQDMQVRLEDIQGVRGTQIAALVNHVQQVSVETVDGLAQMLTASPLVSSSAAAAMLLTLLVRRASRQAADLPHTRPGS